MQSKTSSVTRVFSVPKITILSHFRTGENSRNLRIFSSSRHWAFPLESFLGQPPLLLSAIFLKKPKIEIGRGSNLVLNVLNSGEI